MQQINNIFFDLQHAKPGWELKVDEFNCTETQGIMKFAHFTV